MRTQMKRLLLSLLLVVALIAGMGTLLYGYSARAYVRGAEADLRTLADKLTMQLELRVQQMDFIVLFMMSDPDFLSAISSYTMPQKNEPENQLLVASGATTINRMLRGYAIEQNCYRASLFNAQGDFFSSHTSGNVLPGRPVTDIVADLPWIADADALMGGMLLLAPYADPWAADPADAPPVYGVARAVRTSSGVTCYLEAQSLTADLDALLALPDHPDAEVKLLDAEGRVYYAVGSGENGSERIAAETEPNRYGLYVSVSISRAGLMPLFWSFAVQIITMCFAALLFSFTYIYRFTRKLTRPISALQASMEQTMLGSLGGTRTQEGMDALKTLQDEYASLLGRLNTALDTQLRSQAQTAPRFLYDALDVVADRAAQTGDGEIVEMCGGIASMLGYSTSTQARVATIGAEAEHLGTYLQLMKRHYQHKLEYKIQVEEGVRGQPMPKIVLQPIAENAIRHGFTEKGGVMRVRVVGAAADGRWTIAVEDNGAGFDAETMGRLNAYFHAARVPEGMPGDGYEIGGMGLANTYARLRAYYGEGFQMSLENLSPGARVVISAPVWEEEGP